MVLGTLNNTSMLPGYVLDRLHDILGSELRSMEGNVIYTYKFNGVQVIATIIRWHYNERDTAQTHILYRVRRVMNKHRKFYRGWGVTMTGCLNSPINKHPDRDLDYESSTLGTLILVQYIK